MEGHGAKAIGRDEMRQAIENLIGSPPFSEMAKGKKNVVILFDDFTRPTRVADIIPAVFDSLFDAELAGKLGEDIVMDYPVYNHNAWD